MLLNGYLWRHQLEHWRIEQSGPDPRRFGLRAALDSMLAAMRRWRVAARRELAR